MPHLHHGAWASFSPVFLSVIIALIALLYLRGWLHLRSNTVIVISPWRACSFLLGLLLIWVAVASPIRGLDHESLTVHMLQHLFLMTLAPPLIWLADPVRSVVYGLPERSVWIFTRGLQKPTRGRASGYLSWVSLGKISEFPEGETRLATFQNPYVMPTDGKTVDTACWVRRIAGEQFQVFAINCAHLGCPVRWFPQSGLFMCPCHGGVYYRDGSRASGPPERGLFEYPYKVENGLITIQAGELPTPGGATAELTGEKPPCAS